MMLRKQEEIVNYYKSQQAESGIFFDMVATDLLIYLDFDHVKEFLKPEVIKEEWEKDLSEYKIENVKKCMIDYMSFAWEKAIDERGLSANRSLLHYQNWFWLIGEDEKATHMFDDYHLYGKPKLREIQIFLGLNQADYKE